MNIAALDIAVTKTWPAHAFDIGTKQLAELSQSGDHFVESYASNHGRVMIFAVVAAF
jgi:uncharacterized protein GlcG (DUF336 family)